MSMTPSRRTVESVTVAGVAADNRIFVVRCSLCRRLDNYAARDLLAVYADTTPIHGLFRTCRHCGKPEWVSVKIRLPNFDDVGHLKVLRPVRKSVVAWEEGWFG
jgi:hypothetical protein